MHKTVNIKKLVLIILSLSLANMAAAKTTKNHCHGDFLKSLDSHYTQVCKLLTAENKKLHISPSSCAKTLSLNAVHEVCTDIKSSPVVKFTKYNKNICSTKMKKSYKVNVLQPLYAEVFCDKANYKNCNKLQKVKVTKWASYGMKRYVKQNRC